MLRVTVGEENAFEASLGEALLIIESAEGCHGADVRRQVENGSDYLLLVHWSSVEAHLAFRESELFTSWRALTAPYYREPPSVTHYLKALPR